MYSEAVQRNAPWIWNLPENYGRVYVVRKFTNTSPKLRLKSIRIKMLRIKATLLFKI